MILPSCNCNHAQPVSFKACSHSGFFFRLLMYLFELYNLWWFMIRSLCCLVSLVYCVFVIRRAIPSQLAQYTAWTTMWCQKRGALLCPTTLKVGGARAPLPPVSAAYVYDLCVASFHWFIFCNPPLQSLLNCPHLISSWPFFLMWYTCPSLSIQSDFYWGQLRKHYVRFCIDLKHTFVSDI
jgi:hypothetical protein